ncbi:MAG: ABC transporter substrate-binding protein, partial [Alphaproteobacteria bacterium]|nr:ABC transporter substrate-binding protein [Alphaproteobacteria bacterium]
GDIYPALEKGTIDSAEWVGPYDDEKLGFNKVAKYYYYPGWWEGGRQISAYVGLPAWNSLPPAYKAILESACAEAGTWITAKYDAQNPDAIKRLIAGGAELRPFTPEVMDACYKAAQELWAEIAGKNANFKKIHDSYAKFLDLEYEWFQVAEVGFDNYMVRATRAARSQRK